MRKNVQRMASKLLVLVLTLALVFTSSVGAFAADQGGSARIAFETIDFAEVDVKFPYAGATVGGLEDYVFLTEASEEYYRIENVSWTDAGGNVLESDYKFDPYNWHKLFITLAIEDEARYTVDENADIRVWHDGEAYEINFLQIINNNTVAIEVLFYPEIKGEIEYIELSNVPTGEVGAVAKPYSYTYTAPGTEEVIYQAAGTWKKYNYQTKAYVPMAEDETFAEGGAYALDLEVNLETGYVVDEYDPGLIVNGTNLNGSTFEDFRVLGSVYFRTGREISEVRVDAAAVPKAEVGKSFSADEMISVEVPDDAPYTIEGVWAEADTSYSEGTFEKGKAYIFSYNIYAEEGYHLAEYLDVYFGEDYTSFYTEGAILSGGWFRTSLAEKIDSVTLLNLPEVEVGQTLQSGSFPLQVPDGATYSATGSWCEPNGDLIEDEITAEKKDYRLEIFFYADEGYEFEDQVLVVADGKKEITYAQTTWCSYIKKYNLTEKINEVKITGEAKPVVGQAATTDFLSVAKDAPYTISDAYWVDVYTGETVDVFTSGREYELVVDLEAKAGYSFRGNVKYQLNGESDYSYSYDGSTLCIYENVSLETPIQEIHVNNVPTMKVGDVAKTDIKIPENANYEANANWYVWDDSEKDYVPFEGGTFQEGKSYQLHIGVGATEGHMFDNENLKWIFDGVDADKSELPFTPRRAMDGPKYVGGTFEYSVNLKQIDKIEITMEKPEIGYKADYYEVKTSVPDGANYETLGDGQGDYAFWLEGDIEVNCLFDGYFDAETQYGADFAVRAKEGYEFADDCIVVINGVRVAGKATGMFVGEKKKGRIMYFFDMACDHSYDSGKVKTPATCTAKGAKLCTCTVCGATKTVSIAKLGHKYSSTYTLDKKATTSEDGSKSKHCTRSGCNAKSSVTAIPKIASATLSYTKTTYSGSAKKPTVTVKDSKGNVLVSGTDYSVSYASGRTKVGRYKVTVTYKGKYSGSKALYFTIVPKAPSSATATLTSYYSQTAGYDDVKFSWSKATGASGYYVYYKKSTSSSYTYLTRTTNTYIRTKDLTDGVKYYFKVVPYYKSGDTRYKSLSYKTASVYTLKKLAAPKVVTSSGKAKVSWANINGETGYQVVQYQLKSGKYVKLASYYTTGTSKLFTAAKGKARYYQVRAYKTVDGTKIFGPWSKKVKYTR